MKNKDQDSDNCLYFDISKQERDSAIRYLLQTVINSRGESKFPSNYYTYDEDVNVYLAHLLFAVSLPEYHEMAEPYLSTDTSDILRWVRATEDRTIRYFIFKVNADHLLMHSAIFNDLNGKKKSKSFFAKSEKHFIEVAKLYYEQAAAYHKKIYRKKTGVGDVLTKLSHYFEDYQDVLKHVRRDYFHFVNRFKDNAFDEFIGAVNQYESKTTVKEKMDLFLDLYGKWLANKNPIYINEIIQLVRDIKQVDPSFDFNVQQAFGGGYSDEEKCA